MSKPADLASQAAARSGADICITTVEDTVRSDLRWANDQLHLNSQVTVRKLTVHSYLRCPGGYRLGMVTRPWTDRWAEAVAEADRLAPAGPLFDEEVSRRTPSSGDSDAQKPEAALGLVRSVFDALSPRGATSWTGYATSEHTVRGLASSLGWRHTADIRRSHCELQGRRHGASAWAAQTTDRVWGIDVAALRDEVERRLVWGRNRFAVPAARYDVVLEPSCVADLMLHLYWNLGAVDAAAGKTPFGDLHGGVRLGEPVADPAISLRSDPGDTRFPVPDVVATLESGSNRSVFDNGWPILPTDWISNGRLQNLPASRAEADRMGLAFAPLCDNLILDHNAGQGTSADLVTSLRDGLLITSLWYTRDVDPSRLEVTGLTRDGVYRIRDGEITGQVQNFRFNESSAGILQRVIGAGASEVCFGREGGTAGVATIMPALTIRGFRLTAETQAL